MHILPFGVFQARIGKSILLMLQKDLDFNCLTFLFLTDLKKLARSYFDAK